MIIAHAYTLTMYADGTVRTTAWTSLENAREAVTISSHRRHAVVYEQADHWKVELAHSYHQSPHFLDAISTAAALLERLTPHSLCTCKRPSFSWSGSVPCTGTWRCQRCTKPQANTFDGKPNRQSEARRWLEELGHIRPTSPAPVTRLPEDAVDKGDEVDDDLAFIHDSLWHQSVNLTALADRISVLEDLVAKE